MPNTQNKTTAMSNQTRRSFIKDSSSKAFLAANVSAIAGLINTAGEAQGATVSVTTFDGSSTIISTLTNEKLISVTVNLGAGLNFSVGPFADDNAARIAAEAELARRAEDAAPGRTGETWGDTTGMVSCFEVSPAGSHPTFNYSGSSGARSCQVTAPGGTVTYTFWKTP